MIELEIEVQTVFKQHRGREARIVFIQYDGKTTVTLNEPALIALIDNLNFAHAALKCGVVINEVAEQKGTQCQATTK